MGQDITCIITKKELELDKKIVHFKIEDFTFIPFNVTSIVPCSLIEESQNFTLFKDYSNHLKSENEFFESEDGEHTDEDIINFIEKYEIDSFFLEHYSEWASMPLDRYFMYVKDGEIISNSLIFDEESQHNYINKERYYDESGLHFSWIAMEDIFYSYNHAKEEYFK